MSEKRFKFSTTLDKIYDCDSYDSETHTCESYHNLYDVVDLLNELNDKCDMLHDKLVSLDNLVSVELVPELINLTGLTGFTGEKIDFSNFIKKIECELKM